MIHVNIQLNPDSPPPEPPPPGDLNIQTPVTPPGTDDSWEVAAGDGQQPATLLIDPEPGYRSTNINETNMINPGRPVDEDDNVSPNGDQYCNLNGTSWWPMLVDAVGPKDAGLIAAEGDGTQDTNDDDVPMGPDIYNPNPEKDLKQMVCHFGGDLVNVLRSIVKAGNKWYVIETLDYYTEPVKVFSNGLVRFLARFFRAIDGLGTWTYKGKPISWESHPQHFWTRTNRRIVDTDTWITANEVQAVTDAGDPGGKGDQHLATMSKGPVAYRAIQLGFYEELPARVHVYRDSVVVDGNLVPQAGGETITIDRYRFRGSTTFIRNAVTEDWFIADEMLVRANAEARGPGTLFDYRCYVVLLDDAGKPEPEPWRGRRGVRNPVCGWQRKDFL